LPDAAAEALIKHWCSIYPSDAPKITLDSEQQAVGKSQSFSEILDDMLKKCLECENQLPPKEQSVFSSFNLSSGHFHAMISYRVATEGVGSSNFAHHLYQQLTFNMNLLSRHQIQKMIPLGHYPDYAKYPGWESHSDEVREKMNSTFRFFLDTLCLRDGYGWAEAFSRAVCNSLVFLPILSLHEDEAKDGKSANGSNGDKAKESGGKIEYTGSVGQMVDWDPVGNKDRVDNVLLEIAMANALMELPQEERWLHCIVPVFVGKKDERGNFERFNYQVVKRLSSKASLMTNREVVRRLLSNGYPKDKERLCRILSRSIKDNIQLLLNLQGINMSELGLERYARVLNFVCSFS
jgi:hypothetical protein